MKVALIRVGRGKTAWADAATEDYSRRLSKKVGFEEILLRPAKFHGDEDAVRREEGSRILALVRPGDRLIALDERGDLLRTDQMATLVQQAASASTRRIVFGIGGPYGHAPEVRKAAFRTVALSGMVMNHELARVVIVEQLYRVSTLLWGGKYHH